MKKRSIIPLMIITLVCSMSIISLYSASQQEQETILPSLAPLTRPFFGFADENTTTIRSRDNNQYKGAIIEANAYENVTFWYGYTGGTNESAPYLFGDDGTYTNTSLSWITGTLMTYDNETTVEKGNDIYAYYNYTLNMSSEFVFFRARYGSYEDDIGIPNMLTTGVWIQSTFKQEYYTQYEDIDMNITVHDYNLTSYGLMYREVIPGDYSGEFQNVTVYQDRIGGYANLTAAISHSFAVDTQVEVRAFIEHYDNITKEFRILEENQAHIVTIVEGKPEIEVSSKRFTNSLNVSLYWNASVFEADIATVEIDWDDMSGKENISDISKHRIYHMYSSVGEYNISITVNASSSATNSTYILILIEQIAPEGSIFYLMSNGTNVAIDPLKVLTVETSVKQLTFVVEGFDTGGSGLYSMIVSTDEGNSYEIESKGKITIQFLEYGTHEIYFTILDNAGNSYELTFTIDLIETPPPKNSPIPFPFGIFSIIGLVAIALLFKKLRK